MGGQDDPAIEREVQGVFADEALRLDLAAQCLALVGHGALRMEPRLTFIGEPVGVGGYSWVNAGVPIAFGTETLSEEQAARLAEVWTAVVDDRFRSNKALNLAMRRLSFARHRPRADDSLIDLMIGCEAFFLSDSGGELGYRLALRGAYWSDDADLTQREVFNIYRAAYTARGAIAHGAEVKPNSLKVRGSVVTLPEFVTVVENLLSRVLLRAVDQASRCRDH